MPKMHQNTFGGVWTRWGSLKCCLLLIVADCYPSRNQGNATYKGREGSVRGREVIWPS